MNPCLRFFCRQLSRSWAVLGLLWLAVPALAQTLAFPGALGFGQYATGGRAGSVYHVTTLADSGAGSFRDAVSHSGRIIVFDVGGYITLKTAVSCSGSLTIAGQTAPGGGIGFRGGEISFASRNNIICRDIRVLPGSETASEGDDCLSFYRATNIICDHVSLEFGPYNNIDGVSDDWQNYPVTAITLQNCVIADPSNYVLADSTTGQQFGAHTECVGGTWSWFYNVFANSHNRNPLAKINTVFVNNVLYNCSAGYTTHTSTSFNHDLVNNYFISGPASTSSTSFPWFQVDDNQSMYYSGNLLDSDRDGTLNGSTTTPYWYQGGTGTILTAPWSAVTTNVPTYSAATAFHIVASRAGALPFSQVDSLVFSQLKTLGLGTTGTGAGTTGPDGGLYASQINTGLGNNGYGVLNGAAAAIDSDGDGMPDYWEKAMGLNASDSSDAMTLGADGYANIERYLNWLADPHAMTSTNTAVDVDLWTYTGGFTNFSPVYTVTGISNGVVTLTASHVAHFVPATNYLGLGSFQFTVTASDGSSYTNAVAVLMTSVTTSQNLTWQGDGVANVWTNTGPANWNNGTNLAAFASGDNVTFDDTGSNTPAISLGGAITAGTVYVLANQDYTFGGSGYLASSTALFKTGNGQLTLDTTNTLTGGIAINDGVVQVGDGATCNGGLAGPITNNAALVFAVPGNATNSVSITGAGTVTAAGPGTVTLSGTQTYTGATAITAGTLKLAGTLPPSDITNNGTLILAPSATQNYSNVISGPGSVSVSATGVLALSGTNVFAGNLTNNSGFLVLSNSAAAGTGGIVYNGGFVVAAAGTVITNTFYIPGASASDLCMMATNSGTATWAGNVSISGSGQWRPGSDGGTLVFLGSAAMGSRIFLVPRGAVQFASNAVVSSTSSGFLGRDSSANKRSLNLTIRDNASVTMAGCSIGGGKAGASVTITIQNNGLLSFGANTVDLHDIANAAALSTFRLNGGTFITGGFTKTLTAYTNVIDFNGGVLQAGANNTAFLPAFSPATNAVQAGGALINDGGYAITIAGAFIHDPALGTAPDGGLIKLGGGTLTLSGINTYRGATWVNAGTLVLSGGSTAATLGASTNINLAAGAVLDVTAQMAGQLTLAAGQSLTGNGSVNGPLSVGAGILAPGSNAIGTLTFSNALTLSSASTNIFKLSQSPLTNDSVTVLGALANGGTLIITNTGGTQLAAGSTFQLFNAASYTGTFSTVILPALPFGLAWNTSSLNTAGVISVALATTPAIGSISISTSGLGLSGAGGVGNASFVLLGATNLSTPAGNWTRLLTNQFDGAGNFNFTNQTRLTNSQNFFRLQLQ